MAENKAEPSTLVDGDHRDIIEKLNEEKERLENEIRQEYRNARKYVRSHPEEALAYAFIGGVAAGLVLAKIFSR
ncbi:MAG: hypothetical protein R6U28_03005 [Cyclonatronaceae bacterium]